MDNIPNEWRSALAALVAFARGAVVFCVNPRWGETERREAGKQIAALRAAGATTGGAAPARLYVPSGGSGGRVRFVAHTAATLRAAAEAQCAAMFAAAAGDGASRAFFYSPLPPWHISGIMPFVRAKVCGGQALVLDGSFAPEKPLPPLNGAPAGAAGNGVFRQISLVPTQLRRLLERTGGEGCAWLRAFDCVLLGGAPTGAALLARARSEGIRVALGYGMTETAAFVAWTPPAEFLAAGDSGAVTGTVLRGARVEVLGDDGALLPAGIAGRVAITGAMLSPDVAPRFETNDEGVLDAAGRLRVLGRLDRFIVTGGEKVDPRRVEAALLGAPATPVAGALVIGEPDAEWGRRVTALVVLKGTADGATAAVSDAALAMIVRRQLAPHCVPKRWVRVARLPFDEKGKLDHAALALALGQR